MQIYGHLKKKSRFAQIINSFFTPQMCVMSHIFWGSKRSIGETHHVYVSHHVCVGTGYRSSLTSFVTEHVHKLIQPIALQEVQLSV